MKTGDHILLLSVLLLSPLSGCIDNDLERGVDEATEGFVAEYMGDSGHVRRVVLGAPASIVDQAGARGLYLPLLVTAPDTTHWLDRDHRVVRTDVRCSDTHEDECVQDGLVWASSGGPAPLCLDIRHLTHGEHQVTYRRAGHSVSAIVRVDQEADKKVVTLRPEQAGAGLRESACTFRGDESVPSSYRDRAGTWERQRLQMTASYEPTDLDVPDDPERPAHEVDMWFPGDDADPLDLGMSSREILSAFLEDNGNARSKIDNGGCLGHLSVEKMGSTSKVDVPGEKIAEGDIRIVTSQGSAHQWAFSLYRGATSTEVSSREVDADLAPDCTKAAEPVMSLIQATEASLRTIERGSMTSYYYDVRLPPHMDAETAAPRPHFITAFRPDYVPTGPGTVSYKPYSLYFDAGHHHLVSANLHPTDVERLDIEGI